MTRSARQAIRFARSLGRIFWAALVACFNHRASSKAAALAFYERVRGGGGGVRGR